MAQTTGISYTDSTWPIVAGCQKASGGCANCYAIRDSWRLSHHPDPKVSTPYAGTVEKRPDGNLAWTGVIRPLPERLDWPLHWKKARVIFVCNEADLFHHEVPFEFVDRAFAVMALCPHHRFLVLTKRPERMLRYFTHHFTRSKCARIASEFSGRHDSEGGGDLRVSDGPFPLPNVWLGATVEDQPAADERRSAMEALAEMGWHTWVSYEPALGPVDWRPWMLFLHWAVGGGESGKRARGMDVAWPRLLRDCCEEFGIPWTFKQWGEHLPEGQIAADGRKVGGLNYFARIGRRKAGRLLDGRMYDARPMLPEVCSA